jgi:hypothetical protein
MTKFHMRNSFIRINAVFSGTIIDSDGDNIKINTSEKVYTLKNNL